MRRSRKGRGAIGTTLMIVLKRKRELFAKTFKGRCHKCGKFGYKRQSAGLEEDPRTTGTTIEEVG